MKPAFEFMAANASPDDKSGVAIWRYTDCMRDKEVTVRQHFNTFDAAHEMNCLIDAAWRLGEAEGYDACKRKVLEATA